jgi:hypothetical protein
VSQDHPYDRHHVWSWIHYDLTLGVWRGHADAERQVAINLKGVFNVVGLYRDLGSH